VSPTPLRPVSALVLVRRLALAGMLLCMVVVVLGAWVRLTGAGLGCPDWPTCYGHVVPADDVLEPEKAWHEMIHRYAASTLGLVVMVIAGIAILRRRERALPLGLPVALLATVLAQGLLGALTVWWLVTPVVVLLHLLGGLTTLSLLFWLWLATLPAAHERGLGGFRPLANAVLVLLVAQIALGGWTSANYAAVACPDLPLCQGALMPDMDLAEAFVPVRPLGVDYTGGVLRLPARVAIHFVHRLGAVIVTFAVLVLSAGVLRSPHATPKQRGAAWLPLGALALQLTIGAAMILEGFPLPLATAHNAGAAVLWLSALFLRRALNGGPREAEHGVDAAASSI
jgi:cytochrome c oxidase assembly protein subunit 15